MKVLLTGFGPFPGAPFNPTAPLVRRLARATQPGVKRAEHVFRTSYAAVDRELPALIERDKPDVLIMFGVATATRHLRIETVARNTVSVVLPDATGTLPQSEMIAFEGVESVPLRAPVRRLLHAARSARVPAMLSRDAGQYLCNYLCWQASAAAAQRGGPRLAAFIHVPLVDPPHRRRSARASMTFDDLVRAGEAIVQAAVTSARTSR
jgi:pyroglutamyl-peptidase